MNTSFIRISTDFFKHYKTLRLRKRLGPEGVLSLIALWAYSASSQTNGDLSELSSEDIAAVSFWEKDPKHFVSTLIELGFIDEILLADGTVKKILHDWQKYNNTDRSQIYRQNAVKRWNKEKSLTSVESVNNVSDNTDIDNNLPASDKKVFLENVFLKEEEYMKLQEVLGKKVADEYIQRLNDYIHQIGKQKGRAKYKSHYHVILNWSRREASEVERRIKVIDAIRKKEDDHYFK